MGKKDKRAVAAAAPTRFKGKQDNTQASGGAPYELPNGQWCSKGSCQFNHDKVNPGSPCYRDPRWPGPLPEKVLKSKQQEKRIKNARDKNAKRLQVANLPICAAIAAESVGEAVIDINGIVLNFTLINPVETAGEVPDDQSEHTDPTLDYAVLTNTSTGRDDTITTPNPTSPLAGENGQNSDAPP
eukprot:2036261-Pleurochrysis_carterae.AAC.1